MICLSCNIWVHPLWLTIKTSNAAIPLSTKGFWKCAFHAGIFDFQNWAFHTNNVWSVSRTLINWPVWGKGTRFWMFRSTNVSDVIFTIYCSKNLKITGNGNNITWRSIPNGLKIEPICRKKLDGTICFQRHKLNELHHLQPLMFGVWIPLLI
jgi:hypothetical protein